MKSMKIAALAGLLVAAAGHTAWAAPTSKAVPSRGSDAKLRFDWSLEVVQVAGLADAKVQRAVNAALEQKARARRDAMAKDLVDWEQQPELSSYLDVGMSVGLLSDSLLSISISVETMYSGAAHPDHQLTGLTFDLRSGKELSLGDLVAKEPAARARLASVLDAAMRADPENSDDGQYRYETVEADDITDVVVLEGGKVRFLFGDYQLGPYAAGLTMVDVPVAQLDGLLATKGPLTPSVGLAGTIPR